MLQRTPWRKRERGALIPLRLALQLFKKIWVKRGGKKGNEISLFFFSQREEERKHRQDRIALGTRRARPDGDNKYSL
jgi:hypothetical protein